MGVEADRRFASAAPGRAPDGTSRAAAIDDRRPAAAAQRALRQAIHDGPRLAAQRQIMGAGVVQRLVGFEYEIDDISTQTQANGTWARHAKGVTMQQLNGYRLTADDAGASASRLEVIIDTIDEADPGAAAAAMTLGEDAKRTITAIAKAACRNYRPADQIPGLNGSATDRYRSNDDKPEEIQGQLQMTAGLSMSKLHDHATGWQAKAYLATLDPMQDDDDLRAQGVLANYTRGPYAVMATACAAALFGGKVGSASLQQLGAVAAMMATIPIEARRAGNKHEYAKLTAGSMLARTDFAKILTLLPHNVRHLLTPDLMLEIVLATVKSRRPKVKASDPVIPARALEGKQDLSDLTIRSWVRGVVPSAAGKKGKDQLTKRRFPKKSQRDNVESMGGYGDKVDDANRPIVEFRTLGGIKVADLPPQLERLVDFLNF